MRVLKLSAVGFAIALACSVNCVGTTPSLGQVYGINYNSSGIGVVQHLADAGLSGNSGTKSFELAQIPRSNKELADLKADLDALREELKLMTPRIIGLEQDIARKDAQIKELQSLIDSMDKRFAEIDKNWRAKFAELNSTIEKEREARRKELENFTKVIISEIEQMKNVPQAAPQLTKYTVFVVEKGDTLSAIASATKIPVAELMRVNNLKSSDIKVGQKLKIPAK